MNNAQEVSLIIKGQIEGSLDDSESIELETKGYFYEDGESQCFTYEESELYGMSGTDTIIKVQDNDQKVTLIRLGAINLVMDFKIDQRNVTLYTTPYGEMQIVILTNEINIERNENNLITHIKVLYSLGIGEEVTSYNSINIRVIYK